MSILHGFILPHPPLIVPAVGRGQERGIEKTTESCRAVAERIASLAPDTIVVFSPHSTIYSDYIHISPGSGAQGSLSRFGAPDVAAVRYDAALTEKLTALCEQENLRAGTLGEREPALDHGVLVPLHFIQEAYSDCMLVRVSPSGLSREEHYRFGMLLRRAADDLNRRVVVLASGDMSHKLTADGPYGYVPEGPALDKELISIFATGDFGRLFEIDNTLLEKGAECGFRPMLMLAGALDGNAVKAELLSYEGPFGVGYGVAAFSVTGEDSARHFLTRQRERTKERLSGIRTGEDAFVRLARDTLEGYVRNGNLPHMPQDLPAELTIEQAGVFVSIKKRGQLRGCIGTTGPTTKSIAEEIRQNAIWAGMQDSRFSPVEAEELEELVYSVDVLFPAEPCEESMLDPQEYGVIVESGRKRGLLLPMLEGIDTVSEQLAIAKRKAGIQEGEPTSLSRFRVVRHT